MLGPRIGGRYENNNNNLDKHIKSLHVVPCVLEPYMYHERYQGKPKYLCLYVNDIIIA